MYFDFEDYRPDFTPVGRAISWREGVLLSIIFHLLLVILVLLAPKFLPAFIQPTQVAQIRPSKPQEDTHFVFVQPRRDLPAPRPPERGPASDQDRVARTIERAPTPSNPLPYSRGNSPERVIDPPQAQPQGRGPTPEPAAGEPQRQPQPDQQLTRVPEAPRAQEQPSAPQAPAQPQVARNGSGGRAPVSGGILGEALRSLQRSVQNQAFENPQGGGEFGPEIQFDTKGVEFGPWIRRFIAQVKRNWIVPYAAMSMQGHVVMTFNVHKDGSITDLAVAGASPIQAFNNAAYGALSASNPTQPLPPEYPSDKAFFTVTFYYNESPR